jgi:WD40 repeat protein
VIQLNTPSPVGVANTASNLRRTVHRLRRETSAPMRFSPAIAVVVGVCLATVAGGVRGDSLAAVSGAPIVFASDSGDLPTARLYTVDVSTGRTLSLTPTGYRSEWAPAASPDGSRIAFVRRQLPPGTLPPAGDALVVADANGRQ